jgi:phosphoglycolate phosphatase
MKPRFDAILFDLDGTLTDPRVAITTSITHALRELGAEPPPIDELLWCIGPPIRESVGKLLGADRAHLVERAVEIYRARYMIEGVRETFVYPAVEAILRRLSRSGSKLYLATSKYVVFAEEVLTAFSLRDYFTAVFGSERDGTLAGKTELIRFVLENIETPADRTVMIGDREHDIVGARSNGVFSIGVTYGYGSREELERAGADAVCDTPEEILALIQ